MPAWAGSGGVEACVGRRFIGSHDLARVGGRNASLGELFRVYCRAIACDYDGTGGDP